MAEILVNSAQHQTDSSLIDGWLYGFAARSLFEIDRRNSIRPISRTQVAIETSVGPKQVDRNTLDRLERQRLSNLRS